MKTLSSLLLAAGLLMPGLSSAASPLPSADQPVSLKIERLTQLGEPLGDVKFQVSQVLELAGTQIDLATPEGWALATYLAQNPTAHATATIIELGVTDVTGRITFGNLNQGLFQVEEIVTPIGHYPTIPFFVTLPLTHPDGNSWIYEVIVRPKANSASAAELPPSEIPIQIPIPPNQILTMTGITVIPLIVAAGIITTAWLIIRRSENRNV